MFIKYYRDNMEAYEMDRAGNNMVEVNTTTIW